MNEELDGVRNWAKSRMEEFRKDLDSNEPEHIERALYNIMRTSERAYGKFKLAAMEG